MLKVKCDIHQQYLKKQLTSILSNLNNFHSLEVVDRVSETQLQVGENSDWILNIESIEVNDFEILLIDVTFVQKLVFYVLISKTNIFENGGWRVQCPVDAHLALFTVCLAGGSVWLSSLHIFTLYFLYEHW